METCLYYLDDVIIWLKQSDDCMISQQHFAVKYRDEYNQEHLIATFLMMNDAEAFCAAKNETEL